MRRAWPWIVLLGAIVAIGLLARGGDDTGEPLDPRSTGPLGARALVLLLEQLGADVSIAPSVERGDVAVILVDELGETQKEQLSDFVDGGGTLVVVDPFSDFAPALARSTGGFFDDGSPDADILEPSCALAAVQTVERLSAPGAAGYRRSDGAVGCFPVGDGFYLTARSEGSGTIVALGGGGPLTNERLDEEDNAVLAAAVLGGRPGGRVTVLETGLPGSGSDSLTDLLPGAVRKGLWQLAAAFVFLVAWRARRLGRPVDEPQPVPIPGSELVLATGHLLQAAGRRDEAADMMRLQLRRELAIRYGVPADAPPDQAIAVLTARGVSADRAASAIAPRAMRDDEQLVALAAAIDSLRNEVIHV